LQHRILLLKLKQLRKIDLIVAFVNRDAVASLSNRSECINDMAQLTSRDVENMVVLLVNCLCGEVTHKSLGSRSESVLPRDPTDFHLLVEALRPSPRPGDIDLVVGMRGAMATPEMCNGLLVPVVIFDQMYSFDRDSLIGSIPRPEKTPAERFKEAAGEMFDRILHLTDNAGAMDEHRALNYLTVRYPAIYTTVAAAHERNLSLTAVDVRPSRLSGVRKILDVIFSFTNRTTDVVEKEFVRVDVTEEFPFLVTKMSPYFDL
jgi:hypothetical protein